MTSLPTNINATYPDRGLGDGTHQEHHDIIHEAVNSLTEGTLTAPLEATLDARYRTYDVRTFGAVFDGATDDTAAIQAALDAADTSSLGGVVVCPRGTAIISATLVMGDYTTLIGQGKRSTTIKVADGANLAAIIASEAWFDNGAFTDLLQTVLNLSIDGNRANQASGNGHGVVLHCGWGAVDFCEIKNIRGHGVFFSATTANGSATTSVSAIGPRITRNTILSCTGSGVMVDSNTPALYTDGWCIDNEVGYIDGANGGIHIAQGAGWRYRGNHTYATLYDGHWIRKAAGADISGNCADTFGNIDTGATTVAGFRVEAASARPLTYRGNDAQADGVLGHAGNTYYAHRIRAEDGTCVVTAVGNTWDTHAGATGMLFNLAGGTAMDLTEYGNTGQGAVTRITYSGTGMTVRRHPPPFALSQTSPIAVVAGNSNVFYTTMTANRTMQAITNPVDGDEYTFIITNDPVTPRTLTWDAEFKFPAGVTGALTAAVNAVDVFRFVRRGSANYCLTAAKNQA